jgi:hypothetical protein
LSNIYGARYGVEGLIDDNLIDLRKQDPEQIELLKQTPGAILGSTRKKLPADDNPLFGKIIQTIQNTTLATFLLMAGTIQWIRAFVFLVSLKKKRWTLRSLESRRPLITILK